MDDQKEKIALLEKQLSKETQARKQAQIELDWFKLHVNSERARLYEKIKDQIQANLIGDWQPIIYADADSGKGCFDAKPWMLEVIDPDSGVVMFYMEGTWYSDFNVWYTTMGMIETNKVKRCRPIPQGWLGGGRK